MDIREHSRSVLDLRGVGVLGIWGAAALIESISGDLGGAGHCVAVDPTVQLDHGGFGWHGDVAILS